MAKNTPGRGGKRRKRPLSKRQRRIYRRRRIVVGVALLVALALTVFCVYSLVRGAVAIGVRAAQGAPGIEREAVPDPMRTTGVRECMAGDIELQLVPAATGVGVGGSLDFSASIAYTGSGSCLVNGSDAGRVLTITSGDDQVWRSDSCPVDDRMLLMAKGDVDTQTITWNTNRSGSECVADADLPKVGAGTYVAQLSLKDDPDVVSDPVTFVVQ